MTPGSAEKRMPDPEVPREGPSRVRLERGPQGWGSFWEKQVANPPSPPARQKSGPRCQSLPHPHQPLGRQLTFPNQPWPISSRYRRLCRPRSVDLSSCTVTGQGAQRGQLSLHHCPIFSRLAPRGAACMACSGEPPRAPCSLLMGAAIRSRAPAAQGSCGSASRIHASF